MKLSHLTEMPTQIHAPKPGEERISLNMRDAAKDYVMARVKAPQGMPIAGGWLGARISEGTKVTVIGVEANYLSLSKAVLVTVDNPDETTDNSHNAEVWAVSIDDFDEWFVKPAEFEIKKRERQLRWFNSLKD